MIQAPFRVPPRWFGNLLADFLYLCRNRDSPRSVLLGRGAVKGPAIPGMEVQEQGRPSRSYEQSTVRTELFSTHQPRTNL
jgi:hypothetical protein